MNSIGWNSPIQYFRSGTYFLDIQYSFLVEFMFRCIRAVYISWCRVWSGLHMILYRSDYLLSLSLSFSLSLSLFLSFSLSLSLSHTHTPSSLRPGGGGLGVTFKISREGWGCWIASFRDHIKREKKTKNLNYLHWLISHSLSLSGSPSLCSSISLSISRWWSWWRWRSRWPPLTSATMGRESTLVSLSLFLPLSVARSLLFSLDISLYL